MIKETITAKYGSETVADLSRIYDYAQDIAEMHDTYNVIVVTSGATALGRLIWQDRYGDERLPSKQVLATMGSAQISNAWDEALWKNGISSMQVLCTPHEIVDPTERPELKSVLMEGLERRMVPNVNGNDAMTRLLVDEIEHLYDNDGVGALIMTLMGLGTYVMHSKRGGFFDEHGQEVSCLLPDQYEWALDIARQRDEQAKAKKNKIGTGGLTRKLEAGIRVAQGGANASIVKAGTPLRLSTSGTAGTFIPAVAKGLEVR